MSLNSPPSCEVSAQADDDEKEMAFVRSHLLYQFSRWVDFVRVGTVRKWNIGKKNIFFGITLLFFFEHNLHIAFCFFSHHHIFSHHITTLLGNTQTRLRPPSLTRPNHLSPPFSLLPHHSTTRLQACVTRPLPSALRSSAALACTSLSCVSHRGLFNTNHRLSPLKLAITIKACARLSKKPGGKVVCHLCSEPARSLNISISSKILTANLFCAARPAFLGWVSTWASFAATDACFVYTLRTLTTAA